MPKRTRRPMGPEARAAAFAALLVSACARPAGGHAVPPPPGPRVVLPSGTTLAVELAVTDQEKAQGLMFRESMPREAGMVFLFDKPEIRPFWMKNCHFPLDMIYTLADGTVTDVLKGVPPCTADPCPSFPPKAKADTVVEVNAGVADANGVKPGAKLVYKEIPGR